MSTKEKLCEKLRCYKISTENERNEFFVKFCKFVRNVSSMEKLSEKIRIVSKSYLDKVGGKARGPLRSVNITERNLFFDFLGGKCEYVELLYDLCEDKGLVVRKEWYGDLKDEENCIFFIGDFLDNEFQDHRSANTSNNTKKRASSSSTIQLPAIIENCKKHCQKILAEEKADDIDRDLLSFVEDLNGTVTPINKVLDNPDNRHILIYGPGAMGKTTALINFAKSKLDGQHDEIPIIIQLKNAPGTDEYDKLYVNDGKAESTWLRRSCWGVITNNPRALTCNFSEFSSKIDDVFNDTFANNCYLLFDAIDESINEEGTDGKKRDKRIQDLICEEISLLCQKYPNLKIIVTSRYDESNRISSEEMKKFEVCGFDKDRVLEILNTKKNSYPSENTWARETLDKKIAAVVENERLAKEVLVSPLCLKLYLAVELPEENYKNLNSEGELFNHFFHGYEKVRAKRNTISRMNSMSPDMCSFVLDFILPAFAWNETDFSGIVKRLTKSNDGEYGLEHVCGCYGEKAFPEYTDIEVTAKKFEKFSRKTIIDYCEKDLRVLSKGSQGSPYFSHAVIRTYFKAYYIFTRIQLAIAAMEEDNNELAYKIVSEILREKPLDPDTIRYISQITCEYKNAPIYSSALKEWRKFNNEINYDKKQLYIERLLDLFRNKEVSEDNYSLYNLIEILKTRVDLSGVDFSGIFFSKSGVSFNGCMLSRPGLPAKFNSGAIISRDNLFPLYHTAPITAMALNPNNDEILATADAEGLIKIWNLSTGFLMKTLEPYYGLHKRDSIECIKFVPSIKSDIIAFSSSAGLGLINIENVPLQYMPNLKDCKIEFNFDGSLMVCYSSRYLTIWEKDKKGYKFLKEHRFENNDSHLVAFNPRKQDQLLICKKYDDVLHICDAVSSEEPKHIEKKIDGFIEKLSFNPDGKMVLSLKSSGLVVYDLNEDESTPYINDKYIVDFAFSGKDIVVLSGALFFGSSYDIYHLIKYNAGKQIFDLKTLPKNCVIANGKYIVCKDYFYFSIYNAIDGSLMRTIEGWSKGINDIGFNQDMTKAFVACDEGLKIFSISKDENEKHKFRCCNILLPNENIESAAFSVSDDKELIYYGSSSSPKIVNIDTQEIKDCGKNDKFTCQAITRGIYNNDSKLYRVERKGDSLELFDISGKLLDVLTFDGYLTRRRLFFSGHSDRFAMAMSPDRLSVPGFHGLLHLWQYYQIVTIDNGKFKLGPMLEASQGGFTCIAFGSDDSIITGTSSGFVEVWNSLTGEKISSIENIPGLFICGIDFPETTIKDLSDADKRTLQIYGAKFSASIL